MKTASSLPITSSAAARAALIRVDHRHRPAIGDQALGHCKADAGRTADDDRPIASSDAVQDRDVVGDRGAAHVEDAAELGVLAPACRRPRRSAASRVSTCIDTPVAPIGWPLALRPPDGLTGSRPSLAVQPSSAIRAPSPRWRQPHRLVFDQFGDGEAVMRLDEGEVVERHAGLLQRPGPGLRAAFEQQDVALRHRQEVLHMLVGAEGHGAAHAQRRRRCRSGPAPRRRRRPASSRCASAGRRRRGSSRSRARQKSKPRSLRICA